MDVDGGLEFTNTENPYMNKLDNFNVDKKIGKGQFSEVYRVCMQIPNHHQTMSIHNHVAGCVQG